MTASLSDQVAALIGKITQGNWVVDHTYLIGAIWIVQEGAAVPDWRNLAYVHTRKEKGQKSGEQKHNARAIALVPKLLAAYVRMEKENAELRAKAILAEIRERIG